MALTSTNMLLKIWNLLTDDYDHTEQADNLTKIDQHDHSSGKGVQIGTGGIADGAITTAKLASGTVTKTFRTTHTFTIAGTVAVPSGQTDYIPPFFISKASGETLNIVKVMHRTNTGTATVKLQRTPFAGTASDLTGMTGISVSTTSTNLTPSATSLSEGDLISLVVTAVSSAQNLTLTIVVEHQV